MSNKYRVEHEGFTFTRTSKNRTYTHVVIERCTRTADRERLAAIRGSTWDINKRYYSELAAGQTRPWIRSEEERQELQAKAIEHLAKGRDAFIAEGLVDFDTLHANDPDVYFVAAGWCGRLDLAQKLASKTGNSIILEATPA